MKPFLGRFSEAIYAVMRLVVGFTFACHGAQKWFGVLGGQRVHDPKMLLAGGIEFVGGVLIAIGLVTSLAAFIACGEMAYAYFTVHAPHSFFPIVNKGELAVVYCFVFLYMVARGGGRWSVDGKTGGARGRSVSGSLNQR
jgi:putative oxidoreductase